MSNGNEDIEWIVLEKDSDKALIISKYALDCRPYNIAQLSTRWDNSSLRMWLKHNFMDGAFNDWELEKILDTYTEYDTHDKVFLLSTDEVKKYLSPDDRKCNPTEYAKKRGAGNNVACNWWLRTIGKYRTLATIVYHNGDIDYYGKEVSNDFGKGDICVRPAMWINLGS